MNLNLALLSQKSTVPLNKVKVHNEPKIGCFDMRSDKLDWIDIDYYFL
jgi:hypothetical protein